MSGQVFEGFKPLLLVLGKVYLESILFEGLFSGYAVGIYTVDFAVVHVPTGHI